MPIYHTELGRVGTLTIIPKRNKIDGEGNPHETKGLKISLVKAWSPGFYSDEKGELVQKIEQCGPDMIDTDNMMPGNEIACINFWGETRWKKELEKYLDGAHGKSHGFVKGDPRPQRKITITMTAEEYEKLTEKEIAVPTTSAGAQKVVSGAITTNK